MLTVDEIRHAIKAREAQVAHNNKIRESILAEQRAPNPDAWDKVFTDKMAEAELLMKAAMQSSIAKDLSCAEFKFPSDNTSPLEEEVIEQLCKNHSEDKESLIDLEKYEYVGTYRTVFIMIHWHRVLGTD